MMDDAFPPHKMGLASKVEDMKALDAEARKRELEGLVAKQVSRSHFRKPVVVGLDWIVERPVFRLRSHVCVGCVCV